MTFGKIATDDDLAKRHDKGLKDARDTLDYEGQLSLAKIYKSPLCDRGIQPDGGTWIDTYNIPHVVFEAKKQNDAGNAHERAFKNYHYVANVNPNCKYIIFFMGEGANLTSGIAKTFIDALALEGNPANKLNDTGLSVFFKVEGFSQEEFHSIMLQALSLN